MSRMHVRVTGLVQGVGFRWFVRESARRLEVSGWVRNLDDGSVEVAAEASEDRLAAFTRELQRGPRGARVEALQDAGALPPEPLTNPFTIAH
jgi:acylphosphatase